jgi:hypothetical protein
MKIKGFTLSEVSIGMILGSLIVIFSFSFLTSLNQNLFIQLDSFEKTHELRLFQNILSTNFQHYNPKLDENNTIIFITSSNETNSKLMIYPDSLVYESNHPHVFMFSTEVTFSLLEESYISFAEFKFTDLHQLPNLKFQKEINPGFLIKNR